MRLPHLDDCRRPAGGNGACHGQHCSGRRHIDVERTAALVAEFTRTMSEGKRRREEAIKTVFEAANVGDAEYAGAAARATAARWRKRCGCQRDPRWRAQTPADMTATELAEFGRVARDSFGGAEQWPDSAGLANAALTESFARLGLDINEVREEMTWLPALMHWPYSRALHLTRALPALQLRQRLRLRWPAATAPKFMPCVPRWLPSANKAA